MSAFQDQIEADIGAVFLNPEEFGETHTIDDQSMVCVLESSDGEFVGDVDGAVYLSTLRIHARESDFAKPPVVGKKIIIDDAPYRVLSISHEMGMLTVTVTENSPA
jgi:hypothetical protein